MKRLTINDIAKLAGVSKSTVSVVINNDPEAKVSPHTFAKVQEIVEKYHYSPLPQARALTTFETRQIGFLVSSAATLELANNYFGSILAGVENSCSRYDYRCVVSRYSLEMVNDFVLPRKLRQRNIDALIIAGLKNDPGTSLDELGIPILLIGESSNTNIFQLGSDIENTLAQALKYFSELGHRHILLPYNFESERMHLEAALRICNTGPHSALTGHPCHEITEPNEFMHGRELADYALQEPRLRECTALLANDQICGGFIQRLYEKGLNVPGDYSIISTNDSILMQWGVVPVTSCCAESFEFGSTAAKLLIEYLEQKLNRDQFMQELRNYRQVRPMLLRSSCRGLYHQAK